MPSVCRKVGRITQGFPGKKPHLDSLTVLAFGLTWRLGEEAADRVRRDPHVWVRVRGAKDSERVKIVSLDGVYLGHAYLWAPAQIP